MLTFLFPLVSNMLNKLSGQPESYEKKYGHTRPSNIFARRNLTILRLELRINSEEPLVQVHMVLSVRPSATSPERSPSKSS